MAKYLSPKFEDLFNPNNFTNQSVQYQDINGSIVSVNETVSSNSIQLASLTEVSDTLTLQDSLIKQHNNDLNITTDDGYDIRINNNKPTSGDIIINENSYRSNVNIMNGNLNIKNGYLNLGNGSLILDGVDINAVLVNNTYSLTLQADTLANHAQNLISHSVNIQEAVDTGTTNSSNIVTIQSSYAPLDQPVFTTNITLPPLILAGIQNVSDTQISYLSNLSEDISINYQ